MERYRIFLALGLSAETRTGLGMVSRRMVGAVSGSSKQARTDAGAAHCRPLEHCDPLKHCDLRKHGGPIRLVVEHNLHVTLKFLGEVGGELLGGIRRAAATTALARRKPSFVVRGLGTFPSRGAPRVIWAGIQDRAAACGAGSDGASSDIATTARVLDEALDAQLEPPGYRRDRRPFSAHVTLGRVGSKPQFDSRSGRQPCPVRHAHGRGRDRETADRGATWVPRLRTFLDEHQSSVFGEEVAEAILVMRSRLGPGGPEYEELDRLEFLG